MDASVILQWYPERILVNGDAVIFCMSDALADAIRVLNGNLVTSRTAFQRHFVIRPVFWDTGIEVQELAFDP